MLRTLMIGLDNSAFSQSAIEWGIQTASQFDALLVGLGVIDKDGIGSSEAIPLGGGSFVKDRNEARLKDAHRQIRIVLDSFAQRCAQAHVACKELEEEGTPSECITTIGQRYDLIVLGQESHFSFETQQGPDSTLKEVILRSPRPVVVVPHTVTPGEEIVIAYDGSMQAARAVQAFQSLELYRDKTVHVVSIDPDKKVATKWADRIIDFLHFHHINAQPHAIRSTARPQDVLIDFLNQRSVSMLVMGAYGKMTWREFFFGTVTKRVLTECPVPVFISL
ncbi:MAG: universal stress protein [Planctomycetota bacterium]|nr:universal stress protein [Planctomycetota bacterium]MDA1213467.1 universal stress protein [Planctomycetota bacterium]